MLNCPHCHTSNAPSRCYCQNCGRRIAIFCSRCGFANEKKAHYCGGCGKSLAVEDSIEETFTETKAASIELETAGKFSSEELTELKKINEHRREMHTVSGTRKAVSQEDLDKLFGKET